MKRIIVAAALLAVGFSIIAFGTGAFFTATGTAHNVITSGSVQIELKETDGNGDPYPAEPITDVMPGTVADKVVSVKNTGDNDAWVRVAVDTAVTGETQLDSRYVLLNVDTGHWTERDGYYYYNGILAPGRETEPLFTQVTFSRDMGNQYQNASIDVGLIGYAVQSANNGATVFEAAGWPQA